ncbi:transposase [Kocuria rosea]|uniref:transposase n=1 Tax=Kocuria rosea TaxID=1275 RepID=UPI003F4A0059
MASRRASKRLVGDQLWELWEPLIPPSPPAKHGRTGRPRVDDRAALEGILFVTERGIAWKKRPSELGFGARITCWRRLRAWQKAGCGRSATTPSWTGSARTRRSTDMGAVFVKGAG